MTDNYEEDNGTGLSVEMVMKIMEKHGDQLSEDEAKEVLKIIKMLAGMATNQYFRDE
jgi:nitrogen fixation/metabolism regulation signal transduction histidine kinase